MAKCFVKRFDKYLKTDTDLQMGVEVDVDVSVYSTTHSKKFLIWLLNNTTGEANSKVKRVKDMGGSVKVILDSFDNVNIRPNVKGEGTFNFNV